MTIFLITVASVLVLAGVAELHHRWQKPRIQRRVLEYMRDINRSVYGLELIEASIGSRGSIYIYLRDMEDAGLICSWQERAEPEVDLIRGRLPRRMYQITKFGQAVLNAYEEV